ncbi:MAG: TetR family transcriptional regulator C-terminal domain-containing protein [Oceanospirillaceae bacterium]|nr:TetR family transcriptional regulator C-terminal domain-containing protein [Oceanospirillaceae bacterium]
MEKRVNSKPKRLTREQTEQKILLAAEDVFALYGFQGAAINSIAELTGLTKQNLLYYFPSKEVLYQKVLENILDLWLAKMALFAQRGDDPKTMITSYIQGKLDISRTHPNGSKVFANEIIQGAPRLREYLIAHLLPLLEDDVALINLWIKQGRMDPVDPYHLFFMIWASTQTYADFSSQIELVLGKSKLDEQDFEQANAFLTNLIIKGLGIK